MKLYSMTATFGKLEHQTLTLEPGLNIISAPNEWGKSTWCAFLVAMLYGIDTRERTKTGSLADKERYAPWSGSPMSGSISLSWQGRDITIQRSTKGRSIFGQFRAFETDTGLEVTELTADNCGQVLLGVEKSVFLRSGFIKFSDLPVTEDKALWRRLNALVTTGDESGASDALAQQLKDLKNRCRSNRTNGLIPQAQAEKDRLEEKLSQLSALSSQIEAAKERQAQVAQREQALQHHQAVLAYRDRQAMAQRAAQAVQAEKDAQAKVQALEAECAALPSENDARKALRDLKALQEQALALQMEQQMLPGLPEQPQEEPPFAGLTGEAAIAMAREDGKLYDAQQKQTGKWFFVAGLAVLLLCAVLALLLHPLLWIGGVIGIMLTFLGLLSRSKAEKQKLALSQKYSSTDPAQWIAQAEAAAERQARYRQKRQAWEEEHAQYRDRQTAIRDRLPQEGFQQSFDRWQAVLNTHGALEAARQSLRQAAGNAAALAAVAGPVEPPQGEDLLIFTAPETARLLSDCAYEREQLQRRLGHYQGQMDAIGMPEPLQQKLDTVNARLARLEQTYKALELAQAYLQQASDQLRRRFAPRIAKQAQENLGKLTGGRYDRLTLGADLTLSVSAQGEDTLRDSLWRSDGTADQLYLSLRLAVAQELMPQAPLILDDALVRFDDTRLAAALQLLQEAAADKQVLLFTCQSRESQCC